MKPFFAVDRTADDTNKNPDCEKFNILCVCEETHKEWKAFYAEDKRLLKKASGVKSKRKFLYSLLILSVAIMYLLLYLLSDTFDFNSSGSRQSIILALPLIIGYFFFLMINRYLNNWIIKFNNSEEVKNIGNKYLSLEKKTKEELKIPDNYVMADVIWFHYKLINGVITPVPETEKAPLYYNPAYWLHIKDNYLYIADGLNSFAVELSSLKKIKKINKDLTLPRWKKQKHFTDPVYQEYHIIEKGTGFNIESYYALEIEDKDETWELFFPNYELPAFERLTGLKAETN